MCTGAFFVCGIIGKFRSPAVFIMNDADTRNHVLHSDLA